MHLPLACFLIRACQLTQLDGREQQFFSKDELRRRYLPTGAAEYEYGEVNSIYSPNLRK